MSVKMRVLQNTYFKITTAQASELSASQKVLIEKGKEFPVHSHTIAEKNHVKVAFDGIKLGPEGRNTWYIFADHVEIEGNDPSNKPQDKAPPAPAKSSGGQKKGPLRLPGYNSIFYLSDPVVAGGHLTWSEATHGGTRIPPNKEIVDNIIKIAKAMEEVRALFGNKEIKINSWYRDPASNAKAGGASKSRHMSGDAIDFNIVGLSPPDVLKKLEPWWGNRGGVASASCFTHIDARGYKARWKYPF